MTLRALALTAILGATLSACASSPPQTPPGGPGRPGGESGGPGAMGGRQLFISPAGEPFRAPVGQPYPVAAWFAGADANHDGALSQSEFVADSLRFFAVVDADHDGVIDGFEVSAYETRIAPEIVGGAAPGLRRGPMGQGPGGGPPGEDGSPRSRRGAGLASNVLQGATLYSLLAEPEPVMSADADFNRRITRDEAAKAAKARFALLDRDKDGLLKLDELPKTPAQRMAEDGKGLGGRGGPPRRR
ncbi:hypothetical protein [Caulobacter segnis]|uniref:EF-hand domain-containing protein n=1 Tax=Caulobacter segnis TaxID=88688 RepID=A0A2W5VCJ0_9CAUL|nr:hypothetical protein [Caulobacter segnis]PZR36992.1 MAG: hypothetical protein DI526_02010 [Caulobacter segnis]